MKLAYSAALLEALKSAPQTVQKAFFKQAKFLAQILQHPSLHAKKYDEAKDIWQARVNKTGGSISPLRTTPTGLRS